MIKKNLLTLPAHYQIKVALVLLLLLTALASRTVAPLWGLTLHVKAFIWWIIILAVSWGQGAAMMRFIRPGGFEASPETRTALATGLGLGFLSLEVFLLGLAGFYNTRAITALILLLLLPVLVPLFKRNVRSAFGLWGEVEAGARLPLALVGIGCLLCFLFVLVPPVFFDAMTYHLELPARYLLEGRVFHVAENLYSGYPQLVEILFGAGMALDGVALSGLIALTFLLLSVVLLWGWGKERFGQKGAAWGLALLILTPPFMVVVGFFGNGWALTFYTLATLALLDRHDRSTSVMVLAGMAAGLAAGCKYTALAFALAGPLAAGVAVDIKRKEPFKPGPWMFFLLSALTVASPWYLKNLIFTGDPLYPLMAGITGNIPGLGILAADTHHHTLSVQDLWSWLLLPYNAVFRFWDLQFWMSPGFLPLALLPTLPSLRGSRTSSRFLGIWALVFFVSWYFSFRTGRFLIPLAAVAFLYVGTGFARALSPGAMWSRLLKGTVVLMLLAQSGALLAYEARYANRTEAAFGMIDERSYLKESYPLYSAIHFLNSLDPPPKKVLFLGEMKGFYSRFPREVPTFEMPNRLIELVRKGGSDDEIARQLKKDGFSHILFHPSEMKRLAVKSPFLRMSEEESERLNRFLLKETKVVFNEKGIYVFSLQ